MSESSTTTSLWRIIELAQQMLKNEDTGTDAMRLALIEHKAEEELTTLAMAGDEEAREALQSIVWRVERALGRCEKEAA
jgi:hypothetical protein